MKIAQKIEIQAWMSKPATQKIMSVLQGNCGEPQALFVGGCVRNTLLNKEVDDIDIATILSPEDVQEICSAHNIKTIPTGLEHGTLTIVIEDDVFEITTLRKDISTDGRRAVVAFTQDWLEDARRRDFTINTLLMDVKGHIYDPLQKGLEDIQEKHVTFVGDALARIQEDYLRILRFFRFYSLYAKGDPDKDALFACSQESENIKTLSKERITQEMFKILCSDCPGDTLQLMFKHNVLSSLCFEEAEMTLLNRFADLQAQYSAQSLAPRIILLAGFQEAHIKKIYQELLIPKVVQKDIQMILRCLEIENLSSEMQLKKAMYFQGKAAALQAIFLAVLLDEIVGDALISKLLETLQHWQIPSFPIKGEDLLKKGLKAGPKLGKTLEKTELWWVETNFSKSYLECLDFAVSKR